MGPLPGSWLAAGMADLAPYLQVSHEGRQQRASILWDPSLSVASRSSWASQASAFLQPVCHRLTWWLRSIVVHSTGVFSPSGLGLGLRCQAAHYRITFAPGPLTLKISLRMVTGRYTLGSFHSWLFRPFRRFAPQVPVKCHMTPNMFILFPIYLWISFSWTLA